MTPDLRELYQETIIDHGRHPRNFGELITANHHHEGFNPLCGDKITLHVETKEDVIHKIMFEGAGCAISIASASLMTEILINKSFNEIEAIFAAFHELVTQGNINETLSDSLGKLMVLGGVADFPARVKCATLAWHTLKAILNNQEGVVSTENTK